MSSGTGPLVFPTACQVPVFIIPGGQITRAFTSSDCTENGPPEHFYDLVLHPGQRTTVTIIGNGFTFSVLAVDYYSGFPVPLTNVVQTANSFQFTLTASASGKMTSFGIFVSPSAATVRGTYVLTAS